MVACRPNPATVAGRHLLRVIRLLIATAIGAALGLGSVKLALDDPRADFSPAIGPWRIVAGPETVSDPYAVARVARAGLVGMGAAEGVAFTARGDSDGVPFDPACHYAVEGEMPPAGLWTLTVSDDAGRLPVNPARRVGFTSRDVIRQPDGTVLIVVGRTARPGNFVPTGDLAPLRLTLRVYASGLAGRLPRVDEMPRVTRTDCAGG